MITASTRELVRRTCGFAAGLLLAASLLADPVSSQGRSKEPPGTEDRSETPPGRKKAEPREPGPEGGLGAPGPGPGPEVQKKRRSGSTIPETPAKRALLLDELYALLATAPDEQQAKRTSDVIEQLWLMPTSPTVTVLMERAGRAAAAKKHTVARKLLDSAVSLAPDYPEVFMRRAYLSHSQNDVRGALGDIRRALALDPNHFKALDAMGQMLKEVGQRKAALAAFRKLLEVHPYWPGAKAAFDELAREVDGQEI